MNSDFIRSGIELSVNYLPVEGDDFGNDSEAVCRCLPRGSSSLALYFNDDRLHVVSDVVTN